MSVRYEIVELANGDVALQREQNKGEGDDTPLVTMRFSMELLRCFQSKKIDIAKVMVEAGLERIAQLADEYSKEIAEEEKQKAELEAAETNAEDSADDIDTLEVDAVSHMVH